MGDSDLLIIIGAISLAVYGAQNMIMRKLKEIEQKTEGLFKEINVEIKTLEQASIKRIDDRLNVLTEKFDDIDMDFISDVLQDVDSELLNEREAQIWRLGEREREIARKKEAEEQMNEFIKKKNAFEIKKN